MKNLWILKNSTRFFKDYATWGLLMAYVVITVAVISIAISVAVCKK